MSGISDGIPPDLEQPWRLEVDIDCPPFGDSFSERVAYDELLLEQVTAGVKPPTIRIWHNQQCLVATVKESHRPGFAAACTALAKEKWPVALRRTGGTCVPHGPGVLNLALVYPRPMTGDWPLEESYKLLCAPLQQLLKSYGLDVKTGDVPGSFCDGKFNLQVGKRKLVGTSQRWKGNPNHAGSVVLSHACLLVDLDLLESTARINQFYRMCGYTQQFEPYACATLRECVAGRGHPFSADFVGEVAERLSSIVGVW
jgi:lipoate-protein ligase A